LPIFKKFDHIGIVVGDLKKAIEELSFFFGLECKEQMAIEEAGIQIAFYPLGAGQMELIEFQKPLDDVDPIVTRPRAGVQHVAFQVDDFVETLEELTEKGLRLVRGFPRKGAHGKVAFFYPTAGLDLMIEICEASDE
jgi:methylmalonyl-CoA/ethylmalonyl-CoA epimerase